VLDTEALARFRAPYGTSPTCSPVPDGQSQPTSTATTSPNALPSLYVAVFDWVGLPAG
jgi:hypothetical protein